MRTSESIDKISAALALAQSEFPAIVEDSTNPHFKSKYADLSEIINKTRPILSKNGLAVTQGSVFSEGRLTVIARLLHSSGQWIETEISIRPVKDDPQQIGSAQTYGRRYTWCALVGVEGEPDDDANAAMPPPKPRYEQKTQVSPPPPERPKQSYLDASIADAQKAFKRDYPNIDIVNFIGKPSAHWSLTDIARLTRVYSALQAGNEWQTILDSEAKHGA